QRATRTLGVGCGAASEPLGRAAATKIGGRTGGALCGPLSVRWARAVVSGPPGRGGRACLPWVLSSLLALDQLQVEPEGGTRRGRAGGEAVTEAEWQASENPYRLLRWLQKSPRHRPTPRKLGLFACACGRRLGDWVGDEVTAAGLDLAERLADGTAAQDECRWFLGASLGGGPRGMFTHVAFWAVQVTRLLSGPSPEVAARSVAGYAAQGLGPDEPAEQCRL